MVAVDPGRRALLLGAAALACGLPLAAAPSGAARLTLLHTNDTHSQIEPFGPGPFQGKGGIARRATLVRQLRQELGGTLLLDAGDVFQGTPYFNRYKGVLDYQLMSMMGYDAGTLGNHDFDNGVEGLLTAMAQARFPFVNCHLDARGAPGLGERLDLVVLLSHLGYDMRGEALDDLHLPGLVPGIDVIIGGHTHTFLDAPVRVANDQGGTLVFQVGFGGIQLGRMDFTFGGGRLLASSGGTLPVLA